MRLFIHLVKPFLAPHELGEMLFRWLGKEEQDIRKIMEGYRYSADQIEQAIIHLGIRPESDRLGEALKELTARLLNNGLTPLMIRHKLLDAGFAPEEVDLIHELQAQGEALFERLHMTKFNDADQP